MGDDHHGRGLNNSATISPLAAARSFDALDNELAHLGLHRLDLPRREAARHQLAELGVDGGSCNTNGGIASPIISKSP